MILHRVSDLLNLSKLVDSIVRYASDTSR